MEARISLALATKLKLMFEKEEKFLKFPLGLVFPSTFFDFMNDEGTLGPKKSLNNQAEFARIVNIIPDDDNSYVPDSSRILWNELKNILATSVFARRELTEDEESQLDEAIDFLFDEIVEEDGSKIPVYSQKYKKYYQYKTVYDELYKTYLDKKISIECSTGPGSEELKLKWKNIEEKEFKEKLEQAKKNWEDFGFKLEIEHYQKIKSELEPKKYQNSFKHLILSDLEISEIIDINGRGIGVYNTFFSPSDVFDKESTWVKVNLRKEEIDHLIENAPENLKNIFGNPEKDDSITSVSLEYTNVVIMRPWFRLEYFESKYWMIEDNTIVSDGNIPRKGRIPAFITGMIVARKIEIDRKNKQRKIIFPILGNLSVSSLTKDLKKLPEGSSISSEKKPELRMVGTLILPTIMAHKIPLKTISKIPTIETSKKSSFFRSNVSYKTKEDVSARHFKYLKAKYVGTTIKTMPMDKPLLSVTSSFGSENEPESKPETFDFGGFVVLALVCRRLPKSPNPDPNLVWGS